MNHDCHGDIFTRFGKKWGRCFGDGSIFEIKEVLHEEHEELAHG